MLNSGDQNNLKQVGKKCQKANFPISAVIDYLKHNNPGFGALIHTICLNDNGLLDPTEAKLVQWSSTFVFRIGGADIINAEDLVQQGYYSA